MGPTAVLALLTFQQVGQHGINAPYYAILLCFMTGCIMVLMGILGLGKCTNFDLPHQSVLQYLPPLSLLDDSVVDTATLKTDWAIIALFHVSFQMRGLFDTNKEIHKYKTRNNNNLHLPIANLSKFNKGAYLSGMFLTTFLYILKVWLMIINILNPHWRGSYIIILSTQWMNIMNIRKTEEYKP